MSQSQFEVDSAGLAQLIAGRSKAFLVNELISNSLDERTTHIEVSWTPIPGKPLSQLVVQDDNPTGFADLSHAWRVFAPSAKKVDATSRGRFNLGEKLVISQCVSASIASTSGTVSFDAAGRHHFPRRKRALGSCFTGLVRITRTEHAEVEAAVRSLIIPEGVTVLLNGEVLPSRVPVAVFSATLDTVISDESGVLRPTRRLTEIRAYDPRPGEVATLFELGIPVVALGDHWHLDIGQKIPLTFERDSVRPAFLRGLRAAALNELGDLLNEESASESWVTDALEDRSISSDAVSVVLDRRYGSRRVSFDPSDREANKLAVAAGYVVIPPRGNSKAAWRAIRASGTTLPAGQVTPSRKPYSADPAAQIRKELPRGEWTGEISRFVAAHEQIAERLIGIRPAVMIINDAKVRALATYGDASGGRAQLEYNCAHLGKGFFDDPLSERALSLLIHELGHHIETDHLSGRYYRALTDLGARLARLALNEPELLRDLAS